MFEHAIVSVEGRIDPLAPELASDFMAKNGSLAPSLDAFAASGVADDEGWDLVSHDVLLVGERPLLTFAFRRRVPGSKHREPSDAAQSRPLARVPSE